MRNKITNTLYLRFVYGLWAKVYDNFIDRLFSFNRKKVIDALNIKKHEKIVEVGVGTGLNLPHYPKSCTVIGTDISLGMIKKAKRKKHLANVILKIADARKLPYTKDFFDKALATYVLRVSSNPKMILHELQRVVRTGGTLVVLDQFMGKNRMLLTILQPCKVMLGWGREYNLRDLVTGTGWKIISNHRYGCMTNTRLLVLSNEKNTTSKY